MEVSAVVGVIDVVGVTVGVTVIDTEGVGVTDGSGVGVADGSGVGVADGGAPSLGVTDGVTEIDGVAVGLGVGVGDTPDDGVTLGVGLGVGVGVEEAPVDGVTLGVGVLDGGGVLLNDGIGVGVTGTKFGSIPTAKFSRTFNIFWFKRSPYSSFILPNSAISRLLSSTPPSWTSIGGLFVSVCRMK